MISRAQTFTLGLANFAVAGLLVWALWPHKRNYYILLRFAVCIVAAIGLYVLRPHWIMAVLAVAVIVLFNPVVPFNFAKTTWNVFDLVCAALFVLWGLASTNAPDWFSSGIALLGIGVFLIFCGVQIFASAIRLSSAIQTEGRVIDVAADQADSETQGTVTIYKARYQFTTVDGGRTFTGWADYGAEIGDAVRVIYNPNNPNESRLEGDSDTTIRGATVYLVILGAIGSAIGWSGVAKIREGRTRVKTLTKVA
jgi:hypothetical protein